jgi:hypothetical protein
MKKVLVLIGIVSLFILAGCESFSSGDSYSNDAFKVEETQQTVQKAVPIPKINTSAERKNISKRAQLFDNENKVTYIYLVSYGKVMAFYSVQGKVSSLNSYLTPLDKLVDRDGTTCDGWDSAGSCYVVSAPDIDGAYGDNSDGIFFFTTENAYVEWHGDYMVSDQPLKLTTPPELVREIK